MSALVSSLRTASGLWCDVVDTLHKPIVQVRSTFLKHTETYWKRICPTKWYFTNTKSLVQRPFPDTVTGPSPAPRDFLWRGNKIVKNFWPLWMKRSILTWAWACSSSCQAPSRDCQTPHCCSWRESMDLQAWPYAWRWRFHHSVKRLPVGCSKVLSLTSALLGSVRVRAQVVHAPVQGLGGGEHLLMRQKLLPTLTFKELEEVSWEDTGHFERWLVKGDPGLKEERPDLLSNFSPRLSWVCVWPRCQEVVLLEDEVSGKKSEEDEQRL